MTPCHQNTCDHKAGIPSLGTCNAIGTALVYKGKFVTKAHESETLSILFSAVSQVTNTS